MAGIASQARRVMRFEFRFVTKQGFPNADFRNDSKRSYHLEYMDLVQANFLNPVNYCTECVGI